jgi:DnaJ family protein C protein 7
LSKYEEALEDCNKAIDLDPQYLKAYTRRAACYTMLSKHAEAVRDYEKAQQMDPNNDDLAQSLR